jgi:O-antigen ligase
MSDPVPPSDVPQRPKEDPWEKRERQRERWNNPRGSRRSRYKEDEDPLTADAIGFRQNYVAYGLVAAVVILFFSGVPQIPQGSRVLLAQAGTGLIVLLLATCRGFLDDMRIALRRGPNPFFLLLLLWAGFCLFTAPYKSLAVGDMLRVIGGIGAYFLSAYTLKTPHQVGGTTAGLLFVGVAISLWDLMQIGQHGGLNKPLSTQYSTFGTHENVGSLIVLMVPMALSFALHADIEEKRRLTAMAASLVLGALLLVARTRSAWLGGLVAFVSLAALYFRYGPRDASGKNALTSPIAFIAVGFFLFVAAAGLGPSLIKRASTTGTQDRSLSTRILQWNGGALMARERPVTGWGLGSYLVLQGQWTHRGDDVAQVLTKGVGHDNNAHNYYVQWAADTGLIGIALHFGAITAFLVVAIRGLTGAKSPFVIATACGGIASTLAGAVNAFFSPGYNFHGIFTVHCIWMGLAIAALRPPQKDEKPVPATAIASQPWTVYGAAWGSGIAAAGVLFLWGSLILERGKSIPRGTLQIAAEPAGPAPRGSTILWRAQFKDASGKVQDTAPGTLWQLQADQTILRQAQAALTEEGYEDRGRTSVFQVLIPDIGGKIGRITARATYRDRYGRLYTAWSMKTVR